MQTKPANSPELPAFIARFFTCQTTEPQAVAHCFSEDAVVLDEGHEHRGRRAIAAWNAAAVEKYSFTMLPLVAESEGGQTMVRAKVTGKFPGSPIELRLCFTLGGELISRLEIAP